MRMLNKYSTWYSEGFFNEDAATSADAINAFLQGECAFYCVGLWDFPTCTETMGDNFNIIPIPSFEKGGEPGIVGGIGSGLSVANYTQHPDLAVKLVQHITSKEEMKEFYQVAHGIPMRTDVTVDELSLIHILGGEDWQRLLLMEEGVPFLPDGRVDLANCQTCGR